MSAAGAAHACPAGRDLLPSPAWEEREERAGELQKFITFT